MMLKYKIRILLLIIVSLISIHFFTSNKFKTNDLQKLFDHPVVNQPPPQQQSQRVKGPPPGNKITPQEKPQQQQESKEPEFTKNPKIEDFTIFFDNLSNYKINKPSIKDKYKTEKAKELFSNNDDFLFNKEYLENVLDIPDQTFKELKQKHSEYVNHRIPELIEEGIATFGNKVPQNKKEWDSYHGSSGYVLVGGGKYSWLSFLVIKQLRSVGSKLPIELFLSSEDEYEKKFCEHLKKKYDARCNVFDKKLANELNEKYNIGGYQYKMLALLSSNFENVLYLDSDNFPTINPDYIFDSELYKNTNLILWPDAWARTTNPKFYEISNVEIKENKQRYSSYDIKQAGGKEKLRPLTSYNFENSWFHDFEGTLPDPTSETGVFIINKTTHLKTLLLALYYNVFGPDFYYPLLTQGSAGEGDKETFIAAAHVMKEPWHQTLKQFLWTGYVSKTNNQFTSKALGHYDPIKSKEIHDKKENDPNYKNEEEEKKQNKIIFMHLSYPKFYPNWLYDNHDLIYKDSNDHIRMYEMINENIGYDFDLKILQFFTEALCSNYYGNDGLAIDNDVILDKHNTYMGEYLKYVGENEEINNKRCEEVFIPHLHWLKKTKKNYGSENSW
ncbi:uncharacterized protein KGF55_003486 [Candida pseudojiufengensis]|uniref:uncharacterized protein n=1 Tax=Candida pseudojiufengensis TaxID=497109 RepID=UPI0022250279|nr:uncharacterized protein KGF55_003486 [Candida pseudojiufengensis]KAI5962410.1 hypothetical protein KGF55_003486 [Candida pseudojiufengensis]